MARQKELANAAPREPQRAHLIPAAAASSSWNNSTKGQSSVDEKRSYTAQTSSGSCWGYSVWQLCLIRS